MASTPATMMMTTPTMMTTMMKNSNVYFVACTSYCEARSQSTTSMRRPKRRSARQSSRRRRSVNPLWSDTPSGLSSHIYVSMQWRHMFRPHSTFTQHMRSWMRLACMLYFHHLPWFPSIGTCINSSQFAQMCTTSVHGIPNSCTIRYAQRTESCTNWECLVVHTITAPNLYNYIQMVHLYVCTTMYLQLYASIISLFVNPIYRFQAAKSLQTGIASSPYSADCGCGVAIYPCICHLVEFGTGFKFNPKIIYYYYIVCSPQSTHLCTAYHQWFGRFAGVHITVTI